MPRSINPFVFGGPVPASAFVNRREELSLLLRYLESGRNVFLSAPRKWGKTSLLMRAMDELKKRQPVVFIDCYGICSEEELGRAVARGVLSCYPGNELLSAIRRLCADLSPKITLATTPAITIEVGFSKREDWREAFCLPARLARDTQSKVVFIFDEFQELARLKGVLKILRGSFQHQNDVAFLFTGSRRHMMEKIFHSGESPLYNFGAHMTLQPIAEEEWKAFIRAAFEGAGVRIAGGAVDEVLALSGCHPCYTQRLCFELWHQGVMAGAVTQEEVSCALRIVMAGLADSYIHIWDSATPNQRKVLLAVSRKERDLYSAAFLSRHGFRGTSSVHSSVRRLEKRGILIRNEAGYEVEDVFLSRWLSARFQGDGI